MRLRERVQVDGTQTGPIRGGAVHLFSTTGKLEKDKLAEHGVRVNVIGNLSLLPTDMQLLVEKATSLTRKNQR